MTPRGLGAEGCRPVQGELLTVLVDLDLPVLHLGHLPVTDGLLYVLIRFQVKHFWKRVREWLIRSPPPSLETSGFRVRRAAQAYAGPGGDRCDRNHTDTERGH